MKSQSVPVFISLFSGCGGLDLGFIGAGYKCASAFDIDRYAVETYNRNLPPQALAVDLRDENWLSPRLYRPDLVIAGPPCQGFSTVGNRKYDDARNHLLLVPVDFAIETKARCLLIENVPGALAGAHQKYWRTAEDRLHAAGFVTRTIVVDAGTVGLPQTRRRALLIARRAGREIPDWVHPGHSPRPLRSVLPVPAGTPNHAPKLLASNSRIAQIATHIKPGQKLCNVRASETAVHTWAIPEVFGDTTQEERRFLELLMRVRRRNRQRSWGDADPVPIINIAKLFDGDTGGVINNLEAKNYLRVINQTMIDLRHTFNGKCRRLDPERPTNCVLTKFCEADYFLHPFENRSFTIREAARLQGFPDTFTFVGPERSQANQVGNAVPPPLASSVAAWMKDIL